MTNYGKVLGPGEYDPNSYTFFPLPVFFSSRNLAGREYDTFYPFHAYLFFKVWGGGGCGLKYTVPYTFSLFPQSFFSFANFFLEGVRETSALGDYWCHMVCFV